jgi:hypothetical protein
MGSDEIQAPKAEFATTPNSHQVKDEAGRVTGYNE